MGSQCMGKFWALWHGLQLFLSLDHLISNQRRGSLEAFRERYVNPDLSGRATWISFSDQTEGIMLPNVSELKQYDSRINYY